MPKILPPESGHNVKDELDNIRANPDAYLDLMRQKIVSPYEDNKIEPGLDSSTTDLVASDMLNNINADICCGERQLKVILDGLFRLIKMRNNVIKSTHAETMVKNGTPNYEEAKILFGKYSDALYALTSAINSYRLACLNCLNADCKKRNAKYPVADVQQRAKKIIMP